MNKEHTENYMKQLREMYDAGSSLSDGERAAYGMWADGRKEFESRRMPGITFLSYEMNSFLWTRDVPMFILTLREAGIKHFVFTNTSTALMEDLHAFEQEGCEIKGLATETEKVFGCERKGIEVYIPEKEK